MAVYLLSFLDMKVRITRAPTGVIDGMSLRFYHQGETYDMPEVSAEYLVAEGYALFEMRQRERSSRPRERQRRRPRQHA